MSSRSEWSLNIAFTATEKRFNEATNGICRDMVGDNGPSPGTYDPRTNIADNMQKFNKNYGAFGSKTDVSKNKEKKYFHFHQYRVFLIIIVL